MIGRAPTHASECSWGPSRELKDRGESPAKTGSLARVSQGPMCKGCVTSSMLVVMPARPQSLGMLCPWGGNPRLGVSEPLSVSLTPLCLMPFPVFSVVLRRRLLPGGTDGCRSPWACPGGICFGRPRMHVRRVQWPRAHNISLHPHVYLPYWDERTLLRCPVIAQLSQCTGAR